MFRMMLLSERLRTSSSHRPVADVLPRSIISPDDLLRLCIYCICWPQHRALFERGTQPHTHAHTYTSLSLSPARSLARVGYGSTTRAPGAPLPYVAIKRRFSTRQRCVGIIAAGRRAAHNNLTSPSAAVRRDGGRSGTTDRRYPLELRPGVSLYALRELSLEEPGTARIEL